MILVDTSVWIDHLRRGNRVLAGFLSEAVVLIHPFIAGELACGNLKNRTELLRYLNALPLATVASNEEVMHLIEERKLAGCGIGWVDAHLLASALLSNGTFWTADERLQRAGEQAGAKIYSDG